MNFFEKWLQRRRRTAQATANRRRVALLPPPPVDEVAAAALRNGDAPTVFHAGLRAEQVGRLIKLIEECGEVQHAALKVLEHGYMERTRGGKGLARRSMLERELGDLSAATAALYAAHDLRFGEVKFWERRRQYPAPAPPEPVQGPGETAAGQ
jgi:NTP pyrophosphatase (non-canonical NTP hydrolase)